MTTLQAGVNSFALPDASRRYREGDLAGLRCLTWSFAAAMALLMALLGLCLSAMPGSWGRALFAGNWTHAQDMLWPMALFSAVNAGGFAIWVGVKAAQQGRAVLMARTVSGLAMLLAAAAGADRYGASGAVAGMSIGAVAMCLLLARVLTRAR